MIKIICQYWYLFFIFLLTGYLLNKTGGWVRYFVNRASLVKRYWFFIIPFTVVSIILYYMVLKFSPLEKMSIYISVLGQGLALIFAVFVGYFAFLQVVESRLDKLKERAKMAMSDRSYRRSEQDFEEAYRINPNDVGVLADLLELYLILEDYSSFDEKINQLRKNAIDERETVYYFYLVIAKYLLKQHLQDAKIEIEKMIEFIQKHPTVLDHFNWNFKDIQGSETYMRLNGEAKSIFQSLIKYLGRTMAVDQKAKFEKGVYSDQPLSENEKK